MLYSHREKERMEKRKIKRKGLKTAHTNSIERGIELKTKIRVNREELVRALDYSYNDS